MGDRVDRLAVRLMAIDWAGSFGRTTSRGYLMKEYLRRAAFWAKATNAPGFPFFDIAAAVNPQVRADPTVVERVSAHLAAQLQGVVVVRSATHALHFAALPDAGVPLPSAPPDPFEPLLVMFERGGGFRVGGGTLIEVDTLGIRAGSVDENLRAEPYVALDPASLDSLDR
jgi:hypothetical protein